MGVPVMELFLVQSADQTKRGYTKGILDARRMRKDFGKPEGKITPIKVTLTKDGVLKALNEVPFKRRTGATSGPTVNSFDELKTVSRKRLQEVADHSTRLLEGDFSPKALRPDNWRELMKLNTETREELAKYPTTGFYDPNMYPDDAKKLRGKHPLYIAGWNKTRHYGEQIKKGKRA